MDVQVMGERLPPGVENGDEADLGAQMPGVNGRAKKQRERREQDRGSAFKSKRSGRTESTPSPTKACFGMDLPHCRN